MIIKIRSSKELEVKRSKEIKKMIETLEFANTFLNDGDRALALDFLEDTKRDINVLVKNWVK